MAHDPASDLAARATLDPSDWSEVRALGHQMLDDMIDWVATARDRPVWRHMPEALRQELRSPLPETGTPLPELYADFQRLILPYSSANEHPRMMAWVNGGGNPAGYLAELLAGIFSVNCGGRDHAAIEVERQVIAWAAAMVGMPAQTSGLLVTGSSMANMIAVLVARRAALGETVRTNGLQSAPLVAYASAAAHGCIPRALDMAGLGTAALHAIRPTPDHRMDTQALAEAIAADRAAGRIPFMVIGTVGTVDTAAIDDLAAIAAIAEHEKLWFHVDGAFGATAALSPRFRPLLKGIERADSLAFDFHKWAQIPYDAGCVLIRDQAQQLATFAQSLAYLGREPRGLAGNSPWPTDLGPDLSRGFRALKVWMTLRAYGTEGLAKVVENSCDLAQYLATKIASIPGLELLAPVTLNIVCFRVTQGADDLELLNRNLVADLQESGIAAPSATTIGGKLAIRAAIFNHRTTRQDIDAFIEGLRSHAGIS